MPEIIFDVYFDVTKKDHTATRPPATVPSFAEDQAALQKTTLPSTDSHPHTSITYNADTDEFTTDTAGLNKTQIISLLATTLQLATQTSLNQTPDLEVTISIHALPSDSETNAHAFIAFLCSTEANYVNHIDLPSTDSAETKSLITHLAIMSAYDVNLRDTIQSLLADTCGSATAASQYFESESKKHSKQPTTDASTTTTPLSKLARSAVATSATSDPIDASDPLSPTTMRRMTTTPPRSSTAREMELSA